MGKTNISHLSLRTYYSTVQYELRQRQPTTDNQSRWTVERWKSETDWFKYDVERSAKNEEEEKKVQPLKINYIQINIIYVNQMARHADEWNLIDVPDDDAQDTPEHTIATLPNGLNGVVSNIKYRQHRYTIAMPIHGFCVVWISVCSSTAVACRSTMQCARTLAHTHTHIFISGNRFVFFTSRFVSFHFKSN